MKKIEEICRDLQIKSVEKWEDDSYTGEIVLRGQTKKYIFVAGIDGGRWEHVSVSLAKSNKSMPTWKDMCRIKEIFWNDCEEVHQVHPKAEQYLHGVGDIENVLHLWRPVGGWREFEE